MEKYNLIKASTTYEYTEVSTSVYEVANSRSEIELSFVDTIVYFGLFVFFGFVVFFKPKREN